MTFDITFNSTKGELLFNDDPPEIKISTVSPLVTIPLSDVAAFHPATCDCTQTELIERPFLKIVLETCVFDTDIGHRVYLPHTITFKDNKESALSFAQELYGRLKASIAKQHFLVYLNPVGGKKQARSIFKRAKRILDYAPNVTYELKETEYAQHCFEHVRELNLERFDGIICVSGDGLVNETTNGLLGRPDWRRAIKMPVGLIPAGSCNGTSASLGHFDPMCACFSIVNNLRRPIDMFSILQPETKKIWFGFMQVEWGMMGACDFWSEPLRFLGEVRTTLYGAWLAVILNRQFSLRMFYECSTHENMGTDTESHKRIVKNLVDSYAACKCNAQCSTCFLTPKKHSLDPTIVDNIAECNFEEATTTKDYFEKVNNKYRGLFSTIEMYDTLPDDPLWEEYEGRSSLWILGNTTHATESLTMLKFAHLNSGDLDLFVAPGNQSRKKMLSVLLNLSEPQESVAHGQRGFIKKVKRLVLIPDNSNTMGVDGERIPNHPIEVHCCPGLATFYGELREQPLKKEE